MKQIERFAVPARSALRVATLVLAGSLLASAGAVSAESSDQPTTAAKWVPRKIHFLYTAPVDSTTTYYSCDSLQDKVKAILRELGARDEVVKPIGCVTTGPERFPGVDATFSVLQPVGSAEQGSADAKSVQAHWDKVTLPTDSSSCALMRQVQRNILPLFAMRNQTSGCGQRFSVEVLQPDTSAATGH